jgi:hypothetical protein
MQDRFPGGGNYFLKNFGISLGRIVGMGAVLAGLIGAGAAIAGAGLLGMTAGMVLLAPTSDLLAAVGVMTVFVASMGTLAGVGKLSMNMLDAVDHMSQRARAALRNNYDSISEPQYATQYVRAREPSSFVEEAFDPFAHRVSPLSDLGWGIASRRTLQASQQFNMRPTRMTRIYSVRPGMS